MTEPAADRLSAEAYQSFIALCSRHAVSLSAGWCVLQALDRSGGSMAQFDHPELGGSGQWMAGGMVMIGDMFNQNLKARVDGLCRDLAALAAANPPPPPPPPPSWAPARSARFPGSLNWWPDELGRADWLGSQNSTRYAYFASAGRLAIDDGREVALYDTSVYHLTGVGQQQSGYGASLTFTTPYGVVDLSALRRVPLSPASRDDLPEAPPPPLPPPITPAPPVTVAPPEPPPTAPAAVVLAEEHLANTVWVLGPEAGPDAATLTLGADGTVGGGGPDRRFWAVEAGVLWLYGDDGRVTARFDRVLAGDNGFAGQSPPGSDGTVVLRRPQAPDRPAAAPAAADASGIVTVSVDLGAGAWLFGPADAPASARLRLQPDGAIEGGRSSEARWRRTGGGLIEFLHRSGRPTHRFDSVEVRQGRWQFRGAAVAEPQTIVTLSQA